MISTSRPPNDAPKSASRNEGAVRRYAGPIALIGLAALFIFGPLRWPCPMATVLHVPCPTCGMTRATRFMLRGDFASATHMHPLWFVVLPLLALAFAAEVRGFAKTGAWGAALTHSYTKRIGPIVIALVIVVWVARFFGAFGGPVPIG